MNSEKKVVNVRGYGSSKSSKQTPPGGMTFTMAQIKKATKNFSPSNRIGQGAFGMVYKGKLNNGTVVAIKRAKKDDKGPNLAFDNEVSTLERIDHLNLVKFLGFLDHDNEQLIIVEYISNGTLREHLDCKLQITSQLIYVWAAIFFKPFLCSQVCMANLLILPHGSTSQLMSLMLSHIFICMQVKTSSGLLIIFCSELVLMSMLI